MRVWIPGVPATFATRGEKPWRTTIQAHLRSSFPAGTALYMQFVLPEADPWKRVADLDNFCEPVFYAIGKASAWRRPMLRWWQAEKCFGAVPGLQITFLDAAPDSQPTRSGPILFEGRYAGQLPASALDAEVPAWLGETWKRPALSSRERLGVELCFADSRVNIGDVSTGRVKSLVDCLFPVVGGSAGAPHDWKIDRLTVSKAAMSIGAGVEISIFRLC